MEGEAMIMLTSILINDKLMAQLTVIRVKHKNTFFS